MDITYDRGPVIDEPGGCCGVFICGPCGEGVSVGVTLSLRSADGRLQERTTSTVSGILNHEYGLHTYSPLIDRNDSKGLWADETFLDGGVPLEVRWLEIRIEWNWPDDGQAPEIDLKVWGHGDHEILLASTP